MKYYILNENKKWFLLKVKDGFLLLEDENHIKDKIDLALVKKVVSVNEDGKEDKISITQYLIMTNQLKQGNEWEVNKWIIYVFFSTICSIINGLFSFTGFAITLYTIPLFLISLFCCIQLVRIKQSKRALVLFIVSLVMLFMKPIGEWFFQLYTTLTL